MRLHYKTSKTKRRFKTRRQRRFKTRRHIKTSTKTKRRQRQNVESLILANRLTVELTLPIIDFKKIGLSYSTFHKFTVM
jgi:hypothetical protein